MFAVFTLVFWAVAGHAPDWAYALGWLIGDVLVYVHRKVTK